ncbi:MAG TPA: 5-formyltetrahydrofolate cyclo-ligase [Nevskiaceae bacterium]|nr:5-formyltetrahydrofolate cyclo-ligase [Nevskiaceae bacterium]
MREQLRRRRAQLAPRERIKAAQRAASHLMKTRWMAQARHVAVYLAAGSELDTLVLIERLWRAGKRVYVPRVRAGGHLTFHTYTPCTPLRANAHGIAEPSDGTPRRQVRGMDLVIVPLTAFDPRGNRLGSGAGYYDRTLAARRSGSRPRLLGYAYALQEVPALPAEYWDVRLDAVITEKGVRRWRTG